MVYYILQHEPKSKLLTLQHSDLGQPKCVSFDMAGRTACIISCSDQTFPGDYARKDVDRILQHHIVFAQNLDRTQLADQDSRKVRSLPIGLDLHTLNVKPFWGEPQTPWREQKKMLTSLRQSSKAAHKRIPQVAVTWARTSTSSERFNCKSRPKLFDECASNPIFVDAVGPRTESWHEMVKYGFVYSPNGNGYDCHRTWEAIALGCIVIAQTNPTLLDIKSTYPEMPIVFCDCPAKLTKSELNQWLMSVRPLELQNMKMQNFLHLEA